MHWLLLPLLDVPASVPGWHLHLDVLIPIFLLEGIYLFTAVALQRRSPETRRLSENSVLFFTLGVLVIYIATGTPIDELSDHYLLSAHMLQHFLLGMIAPPLLLVGIPGWMLRPLVRKPAIAPFAYILTRPLVAFAIFNMALVFVHLPTAIDSELRNENSVHLAAHLVLILAGMLMWWPVFGSLKELPRLSYPLQLVYLFVQSFVPAVLTAFIIFTDTTIFPIYATFPRLWGISAIDDQRIGGLIMKLGGTVVLWTVMTVIFFVWFNQEEREEPPIPPPPAPIMWPDVEAELTRMGLTNSEAK